MHHKEAQHIIRSNPNILISDVATQVGFNTPKYFSKCFKKEFGIFPKEYAEELKNG
jgi:YesN/AraC family two-component response regulator